MNILLKVLLLSLICGTAFSEICFPFAIDTAVAYDTFRSLPDGSWEGNTGALASLNIGTPLPYLSEYGFDVQVGGSYGLYDWPGRGSALEGSLSRLQQQGFLTAALSRTTYCEFGFNLAVAYDWMFNSQFGAFALNTNFSQFRYLAAYQICCSDEIGVWGTVHTNTSHKTTIDFPVAFRAVDQINLFWRHLFSNCAQTDIWVGFPYGKGLMFSRPGEFIIGASFQAPLTDCLSVEGRGMYMAAHHDKSINMSKNYASNICIGIHYTFGCGCCQKPYLPIANNSNFIADTNLNY